MNTNRSGQVGLIVVWILGVLFSVFILAVIGSALNLITIPWLRFDSQVNMNRQIITKTYNADNALYNYHWFKETAGSLVALQNKIAIANSSVSSFEASAGARKDWTFEDKTEDARLRTVQQGLQSQYEDVAAEYNARMKETDRSLFEEQLPLFFPL